jgi:DNA processing protein
MHLLFLKPNKAVLERIEGIGVIRAKAIKAFHDFSNAEEEIKFIEKYNIKPLFLSDKNYLEAFIKLL